MKKRSSQHNKKDKQIGKRTMFVWVPLLVLVAFILGIFFVNIVVKNLALEEKDIALGATFSLHYAEDLGLEWREVYLAVLDDLGVRRLRIPAYWDVIESEEGKFDFSDLDWQIEQAKQRDVMIILAVGRKLPRWPECHVPTWINGMEESEIRGRIITMLKTIVKHYKDESTIVAWQVENEPLFPFGECPPPDRSFLKREIAVVRANDQRPIMLTESGELSTWIRTAGLADILGISTYRSVWNKWIGYFYWPITPKSYARRARAIGGLVDQVIISELQAEPWSPGPIIMQPIEEQLSRMNVGHLRDNISFVRRIGLPQVYLWGVEWWYWLKEQGYPEVWEEGVRIFSDAMIQGKKL